jgi:hypothetical protein
VGGERPVDCKPKAVDRVQLRVIDRRRSGAVDPDALSPSTYVVAIFEYVAVVERLVIAGPVDAVREIEAQGPAP